MANYYKKLRKKMSDKLPRGFDDRFWAKAGVQSKVPMQWKFAPVAAVVVIALVFFNTRDDSDLLAYDKKIMEMLHDESIADNLELLAEVELSDTEWKELFDEA